MKQLIELYIMKTKRGYIMEEDEIQQYEELVALYRTIVRAQLERRLEWLLIERK